MSIGKKNHANIKTSEFNAQTLKKSDTNWFLQMSTNLLKSKFNLINWLCGFWANPFNKLRWIFALSNNHQQFIVNNVLACISSELQNKTKPIPILMCCGYTLFQCWLLFCFCLCVFFFVGGLCVLFIINTHCTRRVFGSRFSCVLIQSQCANVLVAWLNCMPTKYIDTTHIQSLFGFALEPRLTANILITVNSRAHSA